MAGVALAGFRNVRHPLSVRLRKSIRAVVTIRTSAGRSGVVHERGLEGEKISVAGVALGVSRHVVGRLTQTRSARLVTGRAIADVSYRPVDMCISHRRPRDRVFMTGVALRGRRNVRHRLHLCVLGQISTTVTS